jgi:hypothetical protein
MIHSINFKNENERYSSTSEQQLRHLLKNSQPDNVVLAGRITQPVEFSHAVSPSQQSFGFGFLPKNYPTESGTGVRKRIGSGESELARPSDARSRAITTHTVVVFALEFALTLSNLMFLCQPAAKIRTLPV